MFVYNPEHTFERTVTVRMPDPDKLDGVLEQSFRMTFLAIDSDEARELDERQEKRSPKERAKHAYDFLVRVSRGWEDLVDAGKNPVPFSEAVLRQLLKRAWFEAAVYEAYRAGMTADPRLGN